MKTMEPVQMVTCLLPSVKIGCDMEIDVVATEQPPSSASSSADSPGCCNLISRGKLPEGPDSAPGSAAGPPPTPMITFPLTGSDSEVRLPNSVFRQGSNTALSQFNSSVAFPMTPTSACASPFNNDESKCSPHSHLLAANRLSGSQRKLHRADDDDVDEDIQRLAASTQFDETSEESDCEAYGERRGRPAKSLTGRPSPSQSPSLSPCRKQSDCVVTCLKNNRLAVIANEHLAEQQVKQNCRRTASFPMVHSAAEAASRQCSHHVSHASSVAGIPVEIVPNLFIGDETASFNEQVLRDLNVTHVVNVTKRIPNWHEKCKDSPLKYFQIPINDHWSENLLPFLPQVVAFIDEARRANCGAFIHCEAGVSRSATIIVAYVMQTFKMKLDDAYELVRGVKSDICPNFAFMMQLTEFEKQLGLSCHENA